MKKPTLPLQAGALSGAAGWGIPPTEGGARTLRSRVPLSVALALALGTTAWLPAEALATPGQITGLAFRDYNANGVQGTYEPAIAGITVKAYDASGNTVSIANRRNLNHPPTLNG